MAGTSSFGTTEKEYNITIKTLDQKTWVVKATKNTTIGRLKELIADEVGIPVGEQKLLYRGQVLEDDFSTLEDHNILKDATVHLGASKHQSSSIRSSSNYTNHLWN